MSDDLKNFEKRVALYVESHRLLEWVDSVSLPPGGWMVTIQRGQLVDIMAMPQDPGPDDLEDGEFWAPTLREALRKATK